MELSRPPTLSPLLSAAQEPQIVLAALTRLRWLAVVGQIAATAVAAVALHLRLPLGQILAVICVTGVSNIALMAWARLTTPPFWLVRAALLLDIGLLTALLYLTGGPQNPFAALYLVHVAMAVIVCGAAWTWLLVTAAAGGYALILWHYLPLEGDRALPVWARGAGAWVALVLVAVLVAVFIRQVIRALREREVELAAVRSMAIRNKQLAALTTLAAGAAHELNTPLGTIAVVAKELELSCEPSGPLAPLLDDARLIRREVDRCRNILSRMRLDLGEDAAPDSRVAVDDLVARIRLSLTDAQAGRLDIRNGAAGAAALAPPHALEQALVVLLRNAFDACQFGEHVMLDVARVGHRVRFEVRDNGSGMTDEVRRRAGEPFFTTKDPGRGMGLGLFLVHRVAERCGATFTIDSELGSGTRCAFEVPEAR